MDPDASITVEVMKRWLATIHTELDKCVEFWKKYSIDPEFGGFYTCLTQNGEVYDYSKFGWMQGRHTWMYAKLYNELDRFHIPEILQIAKDGAQFMYKYMKCPTYNRCYFSMTRDGKPTKIQRQIFTECFYVMAMAELYKATRKDRFKVEVEDVMKRVLSCAREGEEILGRPKLNGVVASSKLAVPMILLKVLMTLEDANLDLQTNGEDINECGEWCLQKIIKHAQRENSVVLENVSVDGHELSGCDGRLLNPGHVIECGWFCLEYGRRHRMNVERQNLFLDTYIWKMFQKGWDTEHGGLFSFLDADGYCPMKLEWNFKMWWPICEAMIAMLISYQHSKEEKYMKGFQMAFEFAMKYLSDEVHGEWFGYLSSQNEIQLSYKGSEWKGFYHVPHALMMCEKLLREIIDQKDVCK